MKKDSMEIDYFKEAQKDLSEKKWYGWGLVVLLIGMILTALMPSLTSLPVALVFITGIGVLVLPTECPIKDKEKIALHAEYLKKLEALERQRQEKRDFILDNGE